MTNKKILLLNPLSSCGDPHMYSPGLAFISSYLAGKGFDVKLIDRNVFVFKESKTEEECNAKVMEEIRRFNPEYIGISMMTPSLKDVSFCCNSFKTYFPDIKIILGGVHPTFEFERTFRQIPEADIIVRGPGEYILEKILSGEEISSISNVVYRKSGLIHETPLKKSYRKEEVLIDYKGLGLNAYWEEFTPLFNGLDIPGLAYMVTSQGCPGHCSFCVDDRFLGTGFFHSDDFVLDEMELLIKKYGRKTFVFLDRAFRLNPKNTISFCKKKIERKLATVPWYAPFRAEFITEEVAGWLKEANCFQVNIGLESGSQKILDSLNKGTTVELNYKVCEILHKHKIGLASAFIYGLPGQTEKDLETNMKLFNSFKFFDSSVNQILPLPGSELYKGLVKEKKINPDDIKYYDMVKSVGSPIAELNFSEIPSDRYIEIFKKHANYIFDTCNKNRQVLISEYGFENIFSKHRKDNSVLKKIINKFKNRKA